MNLVLKHCRFRLLELEKFPITPGSIIYCFLFFFFFFSYGFSSGNIVVLLYTCSPQYSIYFLIVLHLLCNVFFFFLKKKINKNGRIVSKPDRSTI